MVVLPGGARGTEDGSLLLPRAVPPLEVRVRVHLFGHQALEAALAELLLELLADPGLFGGILDLVARAVLNLLAPAGELRQRRGTRSSWLTGMPRLTLRTCALQQVM